MQTCQRGHHVFQEKCRDCVLLKKEWYLTLERYGFEDLEKDERNLDSKCTSQVAIMVNFTEKALFNSRFSYYQWAREKLDQGTFRSETDRIIWENHSEGLPRRDIAPRVGLEHSWVTRRIKNIEGYLKDKIFTVASASYATA